HVGMHLYGLDAEAGELIHLHVSRRLAGEDGDNAQPTALEELVLRHASPDQGPGPLAGMPVAEAPAELLVRVVTTMLRYACLGEYFSLARHRDRLTAKVREALARCPVSEACALLERSLPAVPPELLAECVEALRQPTSWWTRLRLGRRLKAALRRVDCQS